jgi:4-amino-4-deoxy-L-arabinose transferase-like glycosyltransferase
MDDRLRHQLLVVLVAATVFFTNLGGIRLWDRDEPRNAGCAAEMLAADDWVVPVFNGELRAHKPVLLYWLIMSAYSVLGVNEFAARFWSAVCGVGTVLATYHLGRRLFNPQAGLWAALVLASTMMFGVASRAATPDAVLIFFTTMSLLAYVTAVWDSPPEISLPKSWFSIVPMYILMGMAVLAKGPVGLVLPMAVIGMFLLIVRLPARAPSEPPIGRVAWVQHILRTLLRPFAPGHFLRTAWSMRPLTAIAVSMAVALPWYVWVGLRTDGAFLREFFLTHNLNRALEPMENHRGPVVYYLMALCLGFLPWSVFFGPAVVDLVRRLRRVDPWQRGLIFAACWVGVYLGIFSCAQTKLPSYITPAYPGVALLMGAFLHRWIEGKLLVSDWGLKAGLTGLAVAGLAAAVAIPIAAHFFLPGEEWLGVVGLIPLLGAAVCFMLVRQNRRLASAAGFAAMAAVLATTLFGLVAARVDRHQTSHHLLAAVGRYGDANTAVACYGSQEPSWIFYARRSLPLIPASRPDEAKAFLAADPDRLVITTDKHYQQLKAELPADVVVLDQTPYFLRRQTLLLLGRERSPSTPEARISARPTQPR